MPTATESSQHTTVKDILGNIFADKYCGDSAIMQGLANLDTIPSFDPPPPAIPGKEFNPGIMGFRRSQAGGMNLAIACGTAQVRYLSLAKYIALVENLHEEEQASIMLQNFSESDDNRGGRGQILARINAASSAITVIQGVTGRIIRGPSDIALFDVYYIDRTDLTAYYLAAKAQISTADQLETMIATFDGWKAFRVPLNPMKPYA